MKKALILYYSQAGQTERALAEFAASIEKDFSCDFKKIVPNEIFQFPWKIRDFFRVFPRAVQGLAPTIQPLQINWNDYELIILGAQVWFLSPSLPLQGFLQSAQALGLRNKKVVTIMTCRNLWHSASKTLHQMLLKNGAEHLGQITLAETSPVWASFVTTPRWMLTGKKARFLFFPPAGISDEEFIKFRAKGARLVSKMQPGAVFTIDSSVFGSNLNQVSLKLMDSIGIHFFKVWSTFILRVAKSPGIWQDLWLVMFRLNLVLLIITLGPCTKVFELIVGNHPKYLE